MKKSKAASTARMSRTTKQQLSQQPPPSSIMSNNENDVSFGNNVGTATNSAPPDNDYHNHHYSQKQQHLLVNNGNNNMNPPQNPLPSLQYSNGGMNAMYQQQGGQLGIGQNSQLSNGGQLNNGQLLQNGQQSQYVQINQGGQVHTMTRQQQQQQRQQQYPQQRQDHLNNKRQESSGSNGHGQLDADKVALSQKNHRLAKELSDLRVKHREETKVVSRLTMENMNLASRCRQVISEAADLKRKLSGYEKRHGDFGILQKEVLLLRRQIEKQHGNGNGGVEKGGSSRRNRSTSPKKEKRNSGSDGGTSSNTPVDEKKKKKALASAAAAVVSGSVTSLETKNSGETTDLDRIMAQELFKKNGGATAAAGAAAANAGSGSGGGALDGSSGNAPEKKEGSAIAVTKKFQELNISTTTTATTTTTNNGSKVTSASSSNATASGKRSVTPAATITSSTTESANNNSNISTANTKIPISVTTSSATQKDDEFDAEIDMVDFFATSSKPTLGTSSSSAAAANISSNNSGTDTLPATSSQHARSHITHKLKKTETDDHMPEELVGIPGDLLSPSASSKKNVGDNLLSSLDAFEASFASAFPETSFSIKSEAPSSTQLDMSFDVPVFDPFFKSSANKDRDGSLTSTSLQSSPKPKTSSLSSSSLGVTGSGSNHHKDGMKSQLKDLFPDSALTTSPKRGLDLTFDSTFSDVDIGGVGGSSSNSKSGKGKSSLSADKLDSAFSRAHASTPPKTSGGGVKLSSSNRPASLDMSAEIEQLDALASATEKADGGDRKRSIRKVKTPLSYAEPSTKQKLRRGDVLFPKIDADRKMELEAKRSKSGGAAVAAASGRSPTTDLDRIMSEHFSVGNNKKDNKKDGAAPS
uniref:Shugoshin C-terminal domain-containing protein n=1 Tax=Skeletonema marinoi TaxID=267567 RepID=A0A7S2PIR1_9STRA|mmetsp:Transcript_22361/g.38169  ORF Transcript_22361/g.38169 Transcript_22361/m.38169 type:complete len:869 (+) Transcript_22361:328-2934(+)